MSNQNVWTPDKPAAAFTVDELRETSDFKDLQERMAGLVEEEKVIALTRDIIEARWVSVRDARRGELVEEFVTKMRECDPDLSKVNQLVITLDDEDGHTFETKKARAPRWSEDTYAQHIGETFTKEYNSDKYTDASGEYSLRIAAGRNENEKVFMELTEPSGRVLAYPPVDAENPVGRTEDGKPDANAERVECSSISRLLRDSSHRTTLSVWQYFGLQREDSDGDNS